MVHRPCRVAPRLKPEDSLRISEKQLALDGLRPGEPAYDGHRLRAGAFFPGAPGILAVAAVHQLVLVALEEAAR